MTIFLIICFVLQIIVAKTLSFINLRHLKVHGAQVPPGFEEAIDTETLQKAAAYTFDQSRLGLVESLLDSLLLLLFLFGGLLGLYDRLISNVTGSFVLGGILFFLGLVLLQSVIDIPFSLYGTFRLETRYGFTTTTLRLWLSDLVKSTTIGLILTALLTGGMLALIQWSPEHWWIWVWGFIAAVSLFMMYLSPYVIEPLFNKFEPVRDKTLEEEIRQLMGKAGLQVSRVMQVDASRRSRHSNAYFTGIGRVKRIVLYDTLLEQMDKQEVLAILAHEVGHWQKGHIWKRLALTELGALVSSYLAFSLLQWGKLPGLIGLTNASFAAQVIILGFLGTLASFPFTPLGSWLSRRHEREADRFATELSGTPMALASALIKLSKENLSNLHPHPFYAKFYYSHPPVVERVRELAAMSPNPAVDGSPAERIRTIS